MGNKVSCCRIVVCCGCLGEDNQTNVKGVRESITAVEDYQIIMNVEKAQHPDANHDVTSQEVLNTECLSAVNVTRSSSVEMDRKKDGELSFLELSTNASLTVSTKNYIFLQLFYLSFIYLQIICCMS